LDYQHKKYYQYFFLITFIFISVIYFAGYFKIGLLSDSYEDAYLSVTSGLKDKFTDQIYHFRFRPLLFLTLQGIVTLSGYLNLAFDNFIIYNLFNLTLYLILAAVSGITILSISNDFKKALLAVIIILIFPNNIHNLCWSAAFVELLTGIFYISSIFFSTKFIKSDRRIYVFLSLLFFVLALLTKEIAITIPAAVFLINYIAFKKEKLKSIIKITSSHIIVVIPYFVFRLFVLKSIPYSGLPSFSMNPLSAVFDVISKAIISLFVPLDYLIIKLNIIQSNVLIYIYLIGLFISVLYFLFLLKKSKLIFNTILAIVLFIIIISPFVVAGYMRPQLIIIPFISILLVMFVILNEFSFKKIPAIIITLFFLSFWVIWGIQTISSWDIAFTEGKKKMNVLLNTEFDKNKTPLIIGNLSRTNQYFAFDNLNYSYNYWKHHGFVLNDTIYQEIRTVALDFNSINTRINYFKIGNNEYEINTAGDYQFFIIDEFMKPIAGDVLKTGKIEITVLKTDLNGKPIQLKIKILSDSFETFLFSGYELIKL